MISNIKIGDRFLYTNKDFNNYIYVLKEITKPIKKKGRIIYRFNPEGNATIPAALPKEKLEKYLNMRIWKKIN